MVHRGEIIAVGTPDEFHKSSDTRVTDFIEGIAPVHEDVEQPFFVRDERSSMPQDHWAR